MGDEKEFNIDKIKYGEFMDAEDRQYFEKYGSAMEEQAEIIKENIEENIKENYEKKVDDYIKYANEIYDGVMERLAGSTKQYLVHGACLRCSKQLEAENIQKLVYEGSERYSKADDVKKNSMLQILETRTESANGLPFANVSDTRGGLTGELLKGEAKEGEEEENQLNIVSFGNCGFLNEEKLIDVKIIAERVLRILRSDSGLGDKSKYSDITVDKITEGILKGIKSGKGTCYGCMVLNPEWENLPEEYDYVDNSFDAMPGAVGIMGFLEGKQYFQFGGREAINMMSMLFCRFGGGIINAVDSGQNSYNDGRVYVTVTGARLITDKSINPRGIPLYTGRTMVGEGKPKDLTTYKGAKYADASFTRDKTWKEGSNYSYIHPSVYSLDLPGSYKQDYHGTFISNGITFSTADNRIEIACRRGISTCDGEAFDITLAGKYVDIELSDGTVLACIIGGSKGDEAGSDLEGIVHHDGSIFELLETEGEDGRVQRRDDENADKDDLLHGCDIVGAYVYSEKRLYDSTTGEYTYYFSEGLVN